MMEREGRDDSRTDKVFGVAHDGAREQVLAAARRLDGDRGLAFTLGDLIAEVRRQGSGLADATIRTHVVSRMCVNAPPHHGTVYADLERVGRGQYRLRTPR